MTCIVIRLEETQSIDRTDPRTADLDHCENKGIPRTATVTGNLIWRADARESLKTRFCLRDSHPEVPQVVMETFFQRTVMMETLIIGPLICDHDFGMTQICTAPRHGRSSRPACISHLESWIVQRLSSFSVDSCRL